MKILSLLMTLSVGIAASAAQSSTDPKPSIDPGRPLFSGESAINDATVKAKKPVLIYFANDVHTRYTSALDLHVRLVGNTLESFAPEGDPNHEFLVELAARILRDVDSFNTAVDQEVRTLEDGICGKRFRFEAGLAVFRNSSNPGVITEDTWYLDVPWESCPVENKSGDMTRKTLTLPFAPELRTEPMWLSQPMSNGYSFMAALKAVREEFPEKDHRYILIVKSAGDRDHFILPWFEAFIRGSEAKALVKDILSQRSELTDKDGKIREGLEIHRTLNALFRKHSKQPAPLDFLSATKEGVLEEIASVGGGDVKRGMAFTAVLMDVFQSNLESATTPKLTRLIKPGNYEALNVRNVGKFYGRSQTVLPNALPYADLFSLFGVPGNNSKDLHEKFLAWLDKLSSTKGELP